jgi:hypothetical protein
LADLNPYVVEEFYKNQAYPLVHKREEWFFWPLIDFGPLQFVQGDGEDFVSLIWNGSTNRLRITGIDTENNQVYVDSALVDLVPLAEAEAATQQEEEEAAPNDEND